MTDPRPRCPSSHADRYARCMKRQGHSGLHHAWGGGRDYYEDLEWTDVEAYRPVAQHAQHAQNGKRLTADREIRHAINSSFGATISEQILLLRELDAVRQERDEESDAVSILAAKLAARARERDDALRAAQSATNHDTNEGSNGL